MVLLVDWAGVVGGVRPVVAVAAGVPVPPEVTVAAGVTPSPGVAVASAVLFIGTVGPGPSVPGPPLAATARPPTIEPPMITKPSKTPTVGSSFDPSFSTASPVHLTRPGSSWPAPV